MGLRFPEREPLTRNVTVLETLFRLFHGSVFYAAYYVTNDRALAEDVTQETFLKAYERLDQLRDASRVEAWLVRIAINGARDALRRNRNLCPVSGDAEAAAAADSMPENRLLSREERRAVQAAVSALEPEYQEAVFLKYFRGMTVREISEVTGAPEGTVKTRLRRARLTIGELLRKASSTVKQGGE
ncbi:MAG: sigma-70 family RNA polymerase sigma factor [Thermoanaerobacterales bacterium]|nr:sigma-70 family RNA polymerase sigma factor [Bacillota bacterium]MDI6907760.1 sigma-70 family RNA polymerase sigma factor [Thermoanaerobacterales bacterium]